MGMGWLFVPAQFQKYFGWEIKKQKNPMRFIPVGGPNEFAIGIDGVRLGHHGGVFLEHG